VKAIVVAVNKMDLIGWDEVEFDCIAKEVDEYVQALPTPVQVVALPLSALLGDNVVEGSLNTPWYDGPSLLQLLEEFDAEPRAHVGGRVHVQRVIRPQGGDFADFRGYAGVLSGGHLAVGDAVTVQPAGIRTTVKALHRHGKPVDDAAIGHALVVELTDKVDVARGDVLVADVSSTAPLIGETVEVDMCWMTDQLLTVGGRWWFKHGSRTGRAIVAAIHYRHDLHTLERVPTTSLGLNDLGRVSLHLTEPIVADRYVDNPDGGRLILIDELSNTTAGAAMIADAVHTL
jgi:sulfate adenylyltransferase subunit 1 (EFTu-like GTPase family)